MTDHEKIVKDASTYGSGFSINGNHIPHENVFETLKQEPAAWMSDNHLNVTKHADIAESWKQHGGKPIPLYTKPAEPTVIWKNAALRVGEELSTVGPDNYYAFTPQQWLEWALYTIRSTK